MKCDQIDELLSDFIDDELPEGARQGMEAHMAACERCATSLRKLTRTVRFVRKNARVDIEPGTPGETYYEFHRTLVDPSLKGGARNNG